MNRPTRKSLPARSLSAAIASTFVLASLAGCASSGSTTSSRPAMKDSSARAAAFPIDAAAWSKLGYKWDWTGFPYVSPRGTIADIEVFSDVVVTQESGSTVTVLEASNGSQRWSSTLANPLTRFVGNMRTSDPKHGDVLLSSSQSEIYVLSIQTGTMLDRQPLDKVVNTKPLASGDRLIFGTPTGEVYSHWLDRSMKVWGFGTGAAVEADVIRVNDNTVVAVNQVGLISFLNDAGSLSSQAKIFGGPGAPLATGDNMLFIASSDQSLYAYDATGRQLWRLRTSAPLTQKPVFWNGMLLCALRDQGLSAFEAASGKTLWSNKDVHGVVQGVRKGRLIVQDGERLLAIDADRGDVIEVITVKGLQEVATDAFEDGNLYAVGASGVVAKFLPR